MKYDFDSLVERRGTASAKWDGVEERFGLPGLLPMWVADMDFRAPPPIIAALKRAAEHGVFGYVRIPDSYHEAVIAWMRRRHGWEIRRDWMVYCPGVVPALHILIKAHTRSGDQVIVQTPTYHPFFHAIECDGRLILDNPLRLEQGRYRMDLADLESKVTPQTRMVLLCSPHNPVGRVWDERELKELGELCRRHDILVVSDEVHHDLVYSGFRHTPFPIACPDLAERTIVCTAASKSFNLPGLKTSNIIIPDRGLRERFREEMRTCGAAGPNPFGIAATEAAYRDGEEWLDQLLAYLQGNVEFATDYVQANIPGAKVIAPEGTYLLWLDLRGTAIPRERLARFVREEAKVALEPGTLFGAKEDGFERMNIACPRRLLREGLDRIAAAVKSL